MSADAKSLDVTWPKCDSLLMCMVGADSEGSVIRLLHVVVSQCISYAEQGGRFLFFSFPFAGFFCLGFFCIGFMDIVRAKCKLRQLWSKQVAYQGGIASTRQQATQELECALRKFSHTSHYNDLIAYAFVKLQDPWKAEFRRWCELEKPQDEEDEPIVKLDARPSA